MLFGGRKEIGVEPTLQQEIAEELKEYKLRMAPLVERLRLIKSDTEIEMIRRAADYADFGVECLLASSYYGATVVEGVAQTRAVTLRIIQELDDWDRWLSPISVVLYRIIFEGRPQERAQDIARALLSERSAKDVEFIKNEIQRELDNPTQLVGDILSLSHKEEDLREFLRLVAQHLGEVLPA